MLSSLSPVSETEECTLTSSLATWTRIARDRSSENCATRSIAPRNSSRFLTRHGEHRFADHRRQYTDWNFSQHRRHLRQFRKALPRHAGDACLGTARRQARPVVVLNLHVHIAIGKKTDVI